MTDLTLFDKGRLADFFEIMIKRYIGQLLPIVVIDIDKFSALMVHHFIRYIPQTYTYMQYFVNHCNSKFAVDAYYLKIISYNANNLELSSVATQNPIYDSENLNDKIRTLSMDDLRSSDPKEKNATEIIDPMMVNSSNLNLLQYKLLICPLKFIEEIAPPEFLLYCQNLGEILDPGHKVDRSLIRRDFIEYWVNWTFKKGYSYFFCA